MTENLLPAILAGDEWTRHVISRDYEAAFRAYQERFGTLYAEAVQETAGKPEILASELLEEIQREISRQRIWNRAAVRTSAKLTIAQFLSPMLLELEDEDCHKLAEELRDAWNAWRPKDCYQILNYQKIQKGFKKVILGLAFPDDRDHDEDL